MEPTQHDVHVPSTSSARRGGVPRRGRGRTGRAGNSDVRAIARAAGRTCCRPGCATPAAATLVFSYQEQVARLVDLLEQGEPQAYDLCPAHADRTRPPVGWELSDTRPPPSDAPRRLEDDETVEVLAAALRGETPPTRVSVVEGGLTDDELEDDAVTDAAASSVAPPVDEDPLRAALEELQRVAMPDDDAVAASAPAAPATPLRREDALATTPTDVADEVTAPEATRDEPVLEPEVWSEVVSAREAADEAAGGEDDDLTLW